MSSPSQAVQPVAPVLTWDELTPTEAAPDGWIWMTVGEFWLKQGTLEPATEENSSDTDCRDLSPGENVLLRIEVAHRQEKLGYLVPCPLYLPQLRAWGATPSLSDVLADQLST